jgi:predicted type IV restriction endonuclease
MSQSGSPLLSNVYSQNTYFSGNGVRSSSVAAVLKAFPLQRTHETQDETLLYLLAVGYKRPSGQNHLISSEQINQSKENARQKRSRTIKSEVIPEDKSLVNVL